MEELILNSQEELDCMPKDYKGEFGIAFGTNENPAVVRGFKSKDTEIYFVKNCVGEIYTESNTISHACGNAIVHVFGNGVFKACRNAVVFAYDNTDVRVFEDTALFAYDNSKVLAYGNAIVRGRGKTKIVAYTNTIIQAYDDSIVKIIGGGCRVQIFDNSVAKIYEKSVIERIQSFNNARIKILKFGKKEEQKNG